MAKRIKHQIPLNLFPCKNCLLVVYRKYPNSDFKLQESTGSNETLLIIKEGEIVKKEVVEKMTPGCRFCNGYVSHLLSS
jgi:hypothetical protein